MSEQDRYERFQCSECKQTLAAGGGAWVSPTQPNNWHKWSSRCCNAPAEPVSQEAPR